jgi:crotonobetainyl-CoA:carnitine CoA-transferase CaiB-like acyl-CoA transferase
LAAFVYDDTGTEAELGILSGIRVIDCGTYIAAPAAATALSDFGADVIKIERPPHGDPYRYLSLMPPMPASEHAYCWILESRNKRSIALNLNHSDAREALLKLVESADIFVTNYQPQLLEKFCLDYEKLNALNSRLIYAQLSGYGETGPDVDKPGYDMTAYWARSALMSTMHNQGADPCQSPPGFGDHPTSMALFAGIMLALYQREKTGKGTKVSTSLLANGIWSNSCNVQAALVGAKFAERWSRNTTVNPLVNHYVTRDGRRFILCCLDVQRDWPNLCQALGIQDLQNDPRFHSHEARTRNGAELIALMDAAIGAEDFGEITRLFHERDVVYGVVPDPEQVARDLQAEMNGIFAEIADAPAGPIRTVNTPINLCGEEKTAPRFAPGIGQHTVEILQSLGYGEAAIEKMLIEGAVMKPAE